MNVHSSSYTKATIILGPKSWYIKMVIYKPASFISTKIYLKCKQIMKYGSHLSID